MTQQEHNVTQPLKVLIINPDFREFYREKYNWNHEMNSI